jgi:hypothetical protein
MRPRCDRGARYHERREFEDAQDATRNALTSGQPLDENHEMAEETAEGPTFRDFAASAMSGKRDEAAAVLEVLVGLDSDGAKAATDHFQGQITDPAFMMKAMGLRQAVTGGDAAQILSLLKDCFGLEGAAAEAASTRVRETFG